MLILALARDGKKRGKIICIKCVSSLHSNSVKNTIETILETIRFFVISYQYFYLSKQYLN